MNGYARQLRTFIDPQPILYALAGVAGAFCAGLIIARWDLKGAALLLAIPVVLAVILICLYKPKIGLLFYIQLSFIINGISRFVPFQAPFGLLCDAVLLLLLFGILVNARQLDWGNLHDPVFYLVLIWTVLTVLELLNPEALFPAAWFYGVRVESIYWMQLTVLSLVLLRTKKDVSTVVNIWLIWSVIAALWAFKQRYIGLTSGEQAWLNEGASSTHVLFGHLRCFSFYSDAGQFGAEMAYGALLCLIRVFEERSLRQRLFFSLIGLVLFWGYALSGTRGALFVILAGFPLYLLLRGNIITLTIGILVVSSLFGLLKYTSVGSGTYEIVRMRTALDPEDKSFQLRLSNQKKLADYLSTRPFGCGVGSSGDLAGRFTPGSVLDQIRPDSWYVKIWCETGIIGVSLHIFTLIVFLLLGIYRTLKQTDPGLQSIMISLLCGYLGVLVASYGNPIFGQFPTNSIMSVSIVILCSNKILVSNTRQTTPQLTHSGVS